MGRIPFFISDHGFGHAARAAAVISAIQARMPDLHFDIFSRVSKWFFDDSLEGPFTWHEMQTDIGLAQKSPLHADIEKTAEALECFLPFNNGNIEGLSRTLQAQECRLVLCDIAPIGIAAARKAKIPSILIENFTWDWIYEGYRAQGHLLAKPGAYLKTIFEQADYHIQAEPVCRPVGCDLTVRPVSRVPRIPCETVRQRLGIPADAPLVLITMGGIRERFSFLEKLARRADIYFLVPGAADEQRVCGNTVLLPHASAFYHPDLVNCADVVIGKAGYSTLAEVYHAGIGFGYVGRTDFRESQILADFLQAHVNSIEIEQSAFYEGNWSPLLDDLLALGRTDRDPLNGAEQVADFVCRLL